MTLFVTAGTTGFDRLAEEMDRLSTVLQEPVTIQIGPGRYLPRRASFFRFAASLDPYYREASLVVAHGGLATCMEVLELGRPLIGVSNPDRYDDHQRDLLTVLEAEGYLLYCRHLADLGDAVQQARQMRFRRYERPEVSIHLWIREFLNGTDRE